MSTCSGRITLQARDENTPEQKTVKRETKSEKELGLSQQEAQQRVQRTEMEVKELQQYRKSLISSAKVAEKNSERVFTSLIRLIKKRCSEVKKQIRAEQKEAVSRVKEHLDRLKQDMAEQKRRVAELEKLSNTEEAAHFEGEQFTKTNKGKRKLKADAVPTKWMKGPAERTTPPPVPDPAEASDHAYCPIMNLDIKEEREDKEVCEGIGPYNEPNSSILQVKVKEELIKDEPVDQDYDPVPLSNPAFEQVKDEPDTAENTTQTEDISSNLPITIVPCRKYFGDVTEAVSKLGEKLEDILKGEWSNITTTGSTVNILIPLEPRDDILQYSCQLRLDSNTAHKRLSLSEDKRKVTWMKRDQKYPSHPDRFTGWPQVLCREGLSGRCYWEVKWSGPRCNAAVSYKNITRTGAGNNCGFGFSNKSWRLECLSDGYIFRHNNVQTVVSGPQSSRIGVYLDHGAGTLSFYSISDTMTLLHRVQTTFTDPLYPGFGVCRGASVELCELE